MLKFTNKHTLLILCIAGAITRLLYGYLFAPWNEASDQLAWQLILEKNQFNYSHLIHYPHEGGTILISLIAHFINLFTEFSSLTVCAFLLDFSIRYLQLIIVKKVFNLQTAVLFGIWSIFATPATLPWGTVNFGLHAISSIFPFLLLLLLSQKNSSLKHHIYCGFFLGFAVWFYYANIVLVPLFFFYKILTKEQFNKWVFSLLSLALVLGIHIIVRHYADAGFKLSTFEITTIRGEEFSIYNTNVLNRLSHLLSVITNAATTLPHNNTPLLIKLSYYVLFITSLIGFIFISKKQNGFKKSYYLIFSTILLFMLLYLFSPFFYSLNTGNYINFRHLAYVIPFISLFILIGLNSIKYKYFLVLFLALGMYRTGELFIVTKPQTNNDANLKATGWILATKLGHNTQALLPIVNNNPEIRDKLLNGIGWGISASLLHKTNKTKQLVDLFYEYPLPYHKSLLEGIQFSFNKNITPRLNPELLTQIENHIKDRSTN